MSIQNLKLNNYKHTQLQDGTVTNQCTKLINKFSLKPVNKTRLFVKLSVKQGACNSEKPGTPKGVYSGKFREFEMYSGNPFFISNVIFRDAI